MKRFFNTIPLIAALASMVAVARAQVVVWHDDFDLQPIGANSADTTGTNKYGAVAWNYASGGVAGDYGNPIVTITNNNPDNLVGDPSYTHTNNCAFTFTNITGGASALNFGFELNWIATTGGNTLASLRDYILEFDIAIQGDGLGSLGGYVGPVLGVFGNYGGMYYGDGCETNPPVSFFPAPGAGYQHVAMPMDTFATAHANLLPPTDSPLTFFIGFYITSGGDTNIQEIDLANVEIVMTNAAPPPPPTLSVVPAKPGLRVFAQDHTEPYNQEGFSTVDANQSWVGVATPVNPVSYAITIQDFDTVNGYTLFAQFAQNAASGDPYGVYNAPNAFVWSIASAGPGGVFTTAVNWKTNAPQNGEGNNALTLTTTSTNGRGTWTLVFTNDTDGAVIAPDGTSGSFSLDPSVAPSFANPLVIDFGTCPNWNTAGYGQWIDYGRIAITNVVDGNEYDDFTKDSSLDTSLWNPNFSYNNNPAPNCVVLVSTNTPYWVNWSEPSEGFGLETATNLNTAAGSWFSPDYYGNGVVTNTLPTAMGGIATWTLIPFGCLPTADGTQGGVPSPTAFFRLSNPPPSQ